MDERDEYPFAETSFRTVDPVGGGAMVNTEETGMIPNTPMSDMGKQIFSTLTLANEAARIHVKLGRVQFAEEVRRIVGTWAARKPADTVVQEIIELCNREAK